MTKNKTIIIFFILLFIDQLIKFALFKYKFNIIYLNKGIIFGFIENSYIVFILLILGFITLFYLIKKDLKEKNLGLILILVGAISNLLDRFFYKGVVDYINILNLTNFNLADIYIFLGVIIYLIKIKKPRGFFNYFTM